MLFPRHLLLCAAFAFSASLAMGNPIYGVTDSDQFGTLNLNTQTFSLVADLGFSLYGLVPTANGFLAVALSGALESISDSGATTLIGNAGVTPDSMAEIGSTVYLLSATGELYTVNTTTAAASAVGSTGLGAVPANMTPRYRQWAATCTTPTMSLGTQLERFMRSILRTHPLRRYRLVLFSVSTLPFCWEARTTFSRTTTSLRRPALSTL
jgi:hypothetical protein